MNRLLSSAPRAVVDKGFQKAFLYSFGAWIAAWAITWLASPEAAKALGEFGIIIPLLNTVAVFVKKYFDAYRGPRGIVSPTGQRTSI